MGISDSVRQVFAQFRSDPFAWEGFRALSGVLFFVAFVSVSIEYAAARHWSLGVLLTAASGALVVWLAIRAASFGRHHPISLFVLSLFVAVLLGSVVCAGISYILHLQGWAGYNAPQHATMETFRNLYLWTFLDMVPAVDVWKNFPVKSPVEPPMPSQRNPHPGLQDIHSWIRLCEHTPMVGHYTPSATPVRLNRRLTNRR